MGRADIVEQLVGGVKNIDQDIDSYTKEHNEVSVRVSVANNEHAVHCRPLACIAVGDWVRQLDSAHIEYFCEICNLIGIKVRPSIGLNGYGDTLFCVQCIGTELNIL